MRLLFVTPPLDGPATGGTRYNQQLTRALQREGASVQCCTLSAAAEALAGGLPDIVWVDSLYLHAVPELRLRAGGACRLGVLLHYLPTLLRDAAPRALDDLSEIERRALLAADLVLVPSNTLHQLVQRLTPYRHIICVPPAIDDDALAPAQAREHSSCVMVCNLIENKGVRPFLEALAAGLLAVDRFRLRIIGGSDAQPAYARHCVSLVADNALLAQRVEFLGELDQRQVFAWLARSALFVSASRMESYGMALAEARAHGTPILARAGGHVSAHVQPEAGGQLVEDEEQLARALLELTRQPERLQRRIALAETSRPMRSWRTAALEFGAVLESRA
jgi:glycosyltransferase involved in cell wall biosynthesis